MIVLHALGGMGKTQTALEYAHKYHNEYSSVFWVDGTSEDTATLGFRSIAERLVNHRAEIEAATELQPNYPRIGRLLGMGSSVGEYGELSAEKGSTELILGAVKRWFIQEQNRQWLLVLDNVDDLDSFDIRSLIPTTSQGTIIITSRRKECARLGTGFEIEEMLESEGTSLLLRSARSGDSHRSTEGCAHGVYRDRHVLIRHTDERLVAGITKMLGYLPLAIDQAGAYIAAREMALQKYITIYKNNFRRIFDKRPNPGGSCRDRTVLTTWEISYQAILSKNKQSAELLLLCSFLHNEDIWEEMLRRGKNLEVNGKLNFQRSPRAGSSLSVASTLNMHITCFKRLRSCGQISRYQTLWSHCFRIPWLSVVDGRTVFLSIRWSMNGLEHVLARMRNRCTPEMP